MGLESLESLEILTEDIEKDITHLNKFALATDSSLIPFELKQRFKGILATEIEWLESQRDEVKSSIQFLDEVRNESITES